MDGQAVTRSAEADLAVCEAEYLSPSPWTWDHWHDDSPDELPHTEAKDANGNFVASFNNMGNADFVATARTALPFWIREAERYKAALERMREENERLRRAVELDVEGAAEALYGLAFDFKATCFPLGEFKGKAEEILKRFAAGEK